MTTWEQHDRATAYVVAEMIGADNWFTDNPDAATDERLAAAWREYVARLRAVPVPERTEVSA